MTKKAKKHRKSRPKRARACWICNPHRWAKERRHRMNRDTKREVEAELGGRE